MYGKEEEGEIGCDEESIGEENDAGSYTILPSSFLSFSLDLVERA